MGLFEQFPYTNYHEKNLQWLMEHVGEYDDQIKALQDKDAELQQEIDGLDIPGAIDTAIDQLKTDGYFDEVVTDVVENAYPMKSSPLGICRLGRLLDNYGYQNRASVIGGQSICYDNGKYYSCGESSGGQTIAVWSGTGSLMSYKNDYTTLGHANSIAALGAYLYVADGNAATLHKVNMSTLAYEEAIDVSALLANCYGVDVDNGKLYIIGADVNNTGQRAICVDDGNGGFELVCQVSNPSNTVTQGFAVKDGFAYMVYNRSNSIYKVDMTDGTIVFAYYIPTGDGWNPTGESEDLFKIAGELYLASCLYYNNVSSQEVALGQIFRTDIGIALDKNISFQYMETETLPEMNCSENNAYAFNPTTVFTTIEEACYIANYLGKATITATEISHGVVRLLGGIFSIYGASGTRKVDRIIVQNSYFICTQVSTDTFYVSRSYAKMASNTATDIELNRSTVDFNEFYFSYTTSIVIRRSEVNINWAADNVNSALSVSVPESGGTRLRIYSRVRNYIMLLSKLTNSSIAYDCVRMADGRALNFKHNPASDTFTETIYNDATYNQFEAQSGGTYRVRKTDNTYTTLSASDYIIVDAAY